MYYQYNHFYTIVSKLITINYHWFDKIIIIIINKTVFTKRIYHSMIKYFLSLISLLLIYSMLGNYGFDNYFD